MRAALGAFVLLGVSLAYFMLRATTAFGDVPPLPACAFFIGLVGVCIILRDVYAGTDRRLNRLPPPPYFVIDKTHGRYLELAADGTYESCLDFLSKLETRFNAE